MIVISLGHYSNFKNDKYIINPKEKFLKKREKENTIIQYMDFLKKMKNFNFEKTDFNKNILHNTYVLYFISFLSFGKLFFEMMTGDMYYVTVYIIIAFLLSFFNKNMIVILSLSLIFANILKYGAASTMEGFNENDMSKEDSDDGAEVNEVDKALGIDSNTIDDTGVIDKIIGEDSKKKKKDKVKKEKKEKKEKKQDKSDSDDEDDSDEEDEAEEKEKKKSKKHHHEHDDEDDENEKLLKNQELLLKNMKEYKPFLDTIQGLAKNVSGFVKKDSE